MPASQENMVTSAMGSDSLKKERKRTRKRLLGVYSVVTYMSAITCDVENVAGAPHLKWPTVDAKVHGLSSEAEGRGGDRSGDCKYLRLMQVNFIFLQTNFGIRAHK